MNRRLFLSSLLGAAVGGVVAYSFPSIIVPKNIIVPELMFVSGADTISMWTIPAQFGIDMRQLPATAQLIRPFWKEEAFYVNGEQVESQGWVSDDEWYHIVAVRE